MYLPLCGVLTAMVALTTADLGKGADASWLLMVEAGQGEGEDRRITQKSIFVGPQFSRSHRCKEGPMYRQNHLGNCVKVVRPPSRTGQSNFLLHHLQTSRPVHPIGPPSSGPLHFSLPLNSLEPKPTESISKESSSPAQISPPTAEDKGESPRKEENGTQLNNTKLPSTLDSVPQKINGSSEKESPAVPLLEQLSLESDLELNDGQQHLDNETIEIRSTEKQPFAPVTEQAALLNSTKIGDDINSGNLNTSVFQPANVSDSELTTDVNLTTQQDTTLWLEDIKDEEGGVESSTTEDPDYTEESEIDVSTSDNGASRLGNHTSLPFDQTLNHTRETTTDSLTTTLLVETTEDSRSEFLPLNDQNVTVNEFFAGDDSSNYTVLNYDSTAETTVESLTTGNVDVPTTDIDERNESKTKEPSEELETHTLAPTNDEVDKEGAKVLSAFADAILDYEINDGVDKTVYPSQSSVENSRPQNSPSHPVPVSFPSTLKPYPVNFHNTRFETPIASFLSSQSNSRFSADDSLSLDSTRGDSKVPNPPFSFYSGRSPVPFFPPSQKPDARPDSESYDTSGQIPGFAEFHSRIPDFEPAGPVFDFTSSGYAPTASTYRQPSESSGDLPYYPFEEIVADLFNKTAFFPSS